MDCKRLPRALKQWRQARPEKTALRMKKWFTAFAHEH
jgi:hypothetical protein